MLTVLPESQGDLLAVRVSGTMTREDYGQFRSRAEQMMRDHGQIRVLMELDNLHGWSVGAAWEDLKFGLSHLGRFERCAIVGDRKWEAWMTELAKPFFRVEYFDRSQMDEARRWLNQPETALAHHGHGPHSLVGEVTCFVRRHPLTTAAVGLGLGALAYWSTRPRSMTGAFKA